MTKPKLTYTAAEMRQRRKRMPWIKSNRVRGASTLWVLAWAKNLTRFSPSQIPSLPISKAKCACRHLANCGKLTKASSGKAKGWQIHSEPVYRFNSKIV